MDPETEAETSAAGAAFNYGIKTLGGSIAGKVADKVSGWLMSSLLGKSGPSPDEKLLKEVISRLKDVKKRLIKLQTSLDALEKELKVELTKVKWDVVRATELPIRDTIEQRYDELVRLASLPADKRKASDKQAQQLIQEIHADASYGQQINDLIMGDSVGKGLVGLYTDALLNTYLASDNHQKPIQALSTYFASLLLLQLKAVHLVVEAFHALGDVKGAEAAMANLKSNLDKQTELYVHTCERIVVTYYLKHTVAAYKIASSNSKHPGGSWKTAAAGVSEMNIHVDSLGVGYGMVNVFDSAACSDLSKAELAKVDKLADQATGGSGALTMRLFKGGGSAPDLVFEHKETKKSQKIVANLRKTDVPPSAGKRYLPVPAVTPPFVYLNPARLGCEYVARYKIPEAKEGTYHLVSPVNLPLPRFSQPGPGWGCGNGQGGMNSIVCNVAKDKTTPKGLPNHAYGYWAGNTLFSIWDNIPSIQIMEIA